MTSESGLLFRGGCCLCSWSQLSFRSANIGLRPHGWSKRALKKNTLFHGHPNPLGFRLQGQKAEPRHAGRTWMASSSSTKQTPDTPWLCAVLTGLEFGIKCFPYWLHKGSALNCKPYDTNIVQSAPKANQA